MLKYTIAVGAVMLAGATIANAQEARPVIEVIKQAECGCCGGWIARMQQAGFTLNVRDVSGDELYSAKEASGFSDDLWACHTATVAGYTVEGHVPASEIERMLAERPVALGIATPGMPIGSPGMDSVGAPGMGFAEGEKEAYDVMLVNLDGSTGVYASYPGN